MWYIHALTEVLMFCIMIGIVLENNIHVYHNFIFYFFFLIMFSYDGLIEISNQDHTHFFTMFSNGIWIIHYFIAINIISDILFYDL